MLAANDFSLMDDIMRRIGGRGAELSGDDRAAYHEAWAQPGALRGGLNYYRAARMGEQVAAGGVPEEYADQDHLADGRGPDAGDLGRERRGAAPLTDPRPQRVGPAPARGDRPGRRPLGARTSDRTRSTALIREFVDSWSANGGR